MEEKGKHDPLNQPSKAQMGSQRLRRQTLGLHGPEPNLLCLYCCHWLAFGEYLTVKAGVSLTPLGLSCIT